MTGRLVRTTIVCYHCLLDDYCIGDRTRPSLSQGISGKRLYSTVDTFCRGNFFVQVPRQMMNPLQVGPCVLGEPYSNQGRRRKGDGEAEKTAEGGSDTSETPRGYVQHPGGSKYGCHGLQWQRQ